MTGPNSLLKAFLPSVAHFNFPCAITEAARGSSFKRASSIQVLIKHESNKKKSAVLLFYIPPK